MTEFIKLKDSVNIDELTKFRFNKDPANCEDEEDHYYWLNNYFYDMDEWRITVNTVDRHIDILCLCKESGLHNIFNLKPLFDLISNNMVEVNLITIKEE